MRILLTTLLIAVLLAAPAAAQVASPSVPPSPYNARWPREPASGPAPTTRVVLPAPETDTGIDWTLPSIAVGALLIAGCAAVANRPRIRRRRRVAA